MKNNLEILGILTKEYPDKELYEKISNENPSVYFNFLKVLLCNKYYALNSYYSGAYEKESSIFSITRNEKKTLDLYSNSNQSIQINAIVGKNGSGKSTISEILYLMLYNIAINKELIKNTKGQQINSYKGFLNASLILKINEDYCCIDFNILEKDIATDKQKKLTNGIFYHKKKITDDLNCQFELNKDSQNQIEIEELFYLISMNYSMYGLNELKMGSWLKHIFHKNDMYDAPIVINPYREEGVINVNTEDTQNNARVISNLSKRFYNAGNTLSQDYQFNNLNVSYDTSKRKSAYMTDEIYRLVDPSKNSTKNLNIWIDGIISIKSCYSPFDYFTKSNGKIIIDNRQFKLPSEVTFEESVNRFYPVNDLCSILIQNSGSAFDIIHSFFFNLRFPKDLRAIENELGVKSSDRIIEDLFSYFIYKLYRIGYNYPEKFGNLPNESRDGFSENEVFSEALYKALISPSHACFKLKRVYFFLNYRKGKKCLKFQKSHGNVRNWKMIGLNRILPESLKNIKPKTQTNKPINDLTMYFDSLNEHFQKENDLAWRLPPSIFKTKCELIKSDDSENTYDLSGLSSGETQFIYSLQTILYHLINISSNNRYSNVVLLFDEIELYYHPEYQRVFLSTLLKQIEELSLKNIKSIQIVMMTHSPFILSDIPSNNVLRLKEGKPEIEPEQTFAANIHDLLSNSFYLDHGTIGELAFSKLSDLIDALKKNPKEDYEANGKLIELIGDPIIRKQLKKMHDD